MSGTFAVLHIPVAAPGSFRHAEKVWLNGVPAIPGPCPNEGLGIRGPVVYGTARANASYGGGHLFRDIVAGNEISIEVESSGTRFSRTVTLAEMGHARLITTRSAFKNYLAVVNTRPGHRADHLLREGTDRPVFAKPRSAGAGTSTPSRTIRACT